MIIPPVKPEAESAAEEANYFVWENDDLKRLPLSKFERFWLDKGGSWKDLPFIASMGPSDDNNNFDYGQKDSHILRENPVFDKKTAMLEDDQPLTVLRPAHYTFHDDTGDIPNFLDLNPFRMSDVVQHNGDDLSSFGHSQMSDTFDSIVSPSSTATTTENWLKDLSPSAALDNNNSIACANANPNEDINKFLSVLGFTIGLKEIIVCILAGFLLGLFVGRYWRKQKERQRRRVDVNVTDDDDEEAALGNGFVAPAAATAASSPSPPRPPVIPPVIAQTHGRNFVSNNQPFRNRHHLSRSNRGGRILCSELDAQILHPRRVRP
jgi:hypothetical protein